MWSREQQVQICCRRQDTFFYSQNIFLRTLQGKLPALGETYSCPIELMSVGQAVTTLTLSRPFWGTITLIFYCFGAMFIFIQGMGECSTYIYPIDAFKIRSVFIPRQFYTGKRTEIHCYRKSSSLWLKRYSPGKAFQWSPTKHCKLQAPRRPGLPTSLPEAPHRI